MADTSDPDADEAQQPPLAADAAPTDQAPAAPAADSSDGAPAEARDSAVSACFNLVLIDQDNVRAAMGRQPGAAFRERVRRWGAAQPIPTLVLVEVDESKRSERAGVHARLDDDRNVVLFSGPRWRADDGIVRDLEWWLPRIGPQSAVLVVSSDKLVKRRCNEVKQRLAPTCRLRYEMAESFGFQIPIGSSEVMVGTSTQSPLNAFVSSMRDEFVSWINESQPRPSQTASAFVHGGGVQRRGSKRRLGVYR